MASGPNAANARSRGGGLTTDGQSWISCRPKFFLPIRVLSRFFRRLFPERLHQAHAAGKLTFFNDLATLSDHDAFTRHLAPMVACAW